jgi:hypothetical protein
VGECSADPCAVPLVAAGELIEDAAPTDTQEKALLDAVASVGPGGMTPTYPALDGALTWARAQQAADSNTLQAVVLVTDGEPTVCDTSTTEIAKLALSAYLEAGIRTYTIGMQGAQISALNTIAHAGGTSAAFVVRSGAAVEQDLVAALRTISGDMARCQFEINNSEFIDVGEATVQYTSGDDGDPVDLPVRVGLSECDEGGWYYDDLNDPSTAVLCPDTCSAIQSDPEARVSVRIGCAKPLEEVDLRQTYEGACDPGRATQWGYLAWDAVTPSDSSVTLYARTAETAAELTEDLEWTELAVINGSTGNELCALGGTPECTVALYPALGGIPEARFPVLELRAVLVPNSTKTAGAVLNSWEVTYTCLDDE